MFGCLRQIGCLIVLVLGAAAGWYWYTFIRQPAPTAVSTEARWTALSSEGATRTRKAIDALSRNNGPAFATIEAADAASYIFQQLAQRLPQEARGVEATIANERVLLRSVVPIGKLPGPLAGILNPNDTILMGGTIDMVRPGLAQFHVREIRVKEFSVPRAVLPQIVSKIDRGARPQGVADDALPLMVPSYIGDVRVTGGKLTLYKNIK
jgi:hypothetical protein